MHAYNVFRNGKYIGEVFANGIQQALAKARAKYTVATDETLTVAFVY